MLTSRFYANKSNNVSTATKIGSLLAHANTLKALDFNLSEALFRCLLACRVAPRHDNSHEDNHSNRSCLNGSRLGSTGISIHWASSGTSGSAFLFTGFLKLTLHSGHLSFRSSNELLDLSSTWLLPQGRPVTAGGGVVASPLNIQEQCESPSRH